MAAGLHRHLCGPSYRESTHGETAEEARQDADAFTRVETAELRTVALS